MLSYNDSMDPKKEYIFYYTNDSENLYKSLSRFFNHLLHNKLSSLIEQELPDSNQVIFIHRDEREYPELLKIITTSNIKTITLGFDNDSSVNLIDFANLKENFLKVFTQGKLTNKELFSEDEIKEKLKNFFHSHGEDSLFEYLNWTIYYLREGPIQFITGNISYQELVANFIKNGAKNWDKFKSRYLKYMLFIKISKYHVDFNEIEKEVNESDKFVCILKEMSEKELQKKDENYFRESIAKIEKVNHIVLGFYRNLPWSTPSSISS